MANFPFLFDIHYYHRILAMLLFLSSSRILMKCRHVSTATDLLGFLELKLL